MSTTAFKSVAFVLATLMAITALVAAGVAEQQQAASALLQPIK